jgi:hypothetical protein
MMVFIVSAKFTLSSAESRRRALQVHWNPSLHPGKTTQQ